MQNNRFKFRVWDKDKNRFSNCINNELRLGCEGILTLPLTKSDTYIIQQFTGLKDSEGKDIYEGDILERSYTRSDGKKEQIYYNYYEVLFYCGEFEINGSEYSIGVNGFCAKMIKTTNKESSSYIGRILPLANEIKVENCGAFGFNAAEMKTICHIFDDKNLLK